VKVVAADLGIMGTGSNFFRSGLVHSTGRVYIGTYGPPPALVWCYDPATARLQQVGAPGEYQIDSMVEAPNGIVYMGTAYSALVYRLDPATNCITSLGTPAVDSTSWIFTMIRTRAGAIYGAKGVGLFRLDWESERLEPITLVPGDHRTAGPNASSPITRQLVEAPDGTLWGDTNRWLFRYVPGESTVEPLVDMVTVDPACYALMLPQQPMPDGDCYLILYARFSGQQVRHPLIAYRSAEQRIEPLEIEGWQGLASGHPDWWYAPEPLLLVPTWDSENERSSITVIDPYARCVVDRWTAPTNVTSLSRLPGPGILYLAGPRGALLKAWPPDHAFRTLAENPVPAECRCLAMSADGRLGTDTYDCGCVFTRHTASPEVHDHGRVWLDDHRCNYGPAAFAGTDSRYFLANHSEGMPSLWVTDLARNRHWSVGPSAVQLVTMADGSVWGTTGPNPPAYSYDGARCWCPGWQARPGNLFRYLPGDVVVSHVPGMTVAGPLAPAPGPAPAALVLTGPKARVVALNGDAVFAEHALPAEALCACGRGGASPAFVVLTDRTLWRVSWSDASHAYEVTRVACGFGAVERGLLVLPASGRVVGLGNDGTVTVWDPDTRQLSRCEGPAPLPAGPALDLVNDAWYFAHQRVQGHRLEE